MGLTLQQRIEILSDLWGKVFLFHPNVVSPESGANWYDVFPAALSAIEAAWTGSACARALNDFLFEPLNDPFAVAQCVKDHDTAGARDAAPEGIAFVPVAGAPATKRLRLSPAAATRAGLLPEMFRALESASDADLVVVDLRWGSCSEPGCPTGFLGLWTDGNPRTAPCAVRVHRGWHELPSAYVYSHRWEISEGRPLDAPLPDSVRTYPHTVILVDNGSILLFRKALSALKGAPRVRTVWQRTGAFSIPGEQCLRYPGGIRVHLDFSTPAFEPDLIVRAEIPDSAFPELQHSLFAVPARPSSAPCCSSPRAPSVPTASDAIPSRSMRLLGLAKIAVILRHFYPHFRLADIRRGDLLRQWIPRIEAAAGWREYCLALEGLLAKLNDSHAAVSHPALELENKGVIPAEFLMRDGRPVVCRAPADAPLSPGDEVLAIDGRPFAEVVEGWHARISACSEQAFLRDLFCRLRRGPKGTWLQITCRRAEAIRSVTVVRKEPAPALVSRAAAAASLCLPGCGHAVRLEGRLAYLMPFEIPNVALLDIAFDMIRDSDGLLLDLRGYPAAHFQHALVRRLCSRPVRSPRYEIPVASGPCAKRPRWKVIRYTIRPEDESPPPRCYDRPVVGLISEESQSSAEDFCMYLRIAGRVTFVGRRTAGCHGNAAVACLPGGIRVSFTGMRVRWPDGRPFQGTGIVPEVEVEPSLSGLIAGKDEILERGLEVLRQLGGMS